MEFLVGSTEETLGIIQDISGTILYLLSRSFAFRGFPQLREDRE